MLFKVVIFVILVFMTAIKKKSLLYSPLRKVIQALYCSLEVFKHLNNKTE